VSTLVNDSPATTRPAHEVAEVFRLYGAAYRTEHRLTTEQRRVMTAIELCRTAALGGHLEECDQCGYQRPVYNSCRNRHCPKCQGLARARWLADRQAELLPVGYFHTVFTLPHELNDLLAANPRPLYNLLFQCAAQTLQAFGSDPLYGLGGQLGFTAILHTWDQKLLYHVHLHCVIAGGALAANGSRWLPARANYLFPVRELSGAFRARYLRGLRQLFDQGRLRFPGRLQAHADAGAFATFLEPVASKDWVVYSQPPFGGPAKVLEYLSRYTHRVALSNHRLRAVGEGSVTFRYRDRREHNRQKELILSAEEFIRRFLLHITPPGLCRMRHYGFLSNRVKQEQLKRCRTLLGPSASAAATNPALLTLPAWLSETDVKCCPECGHGKMIAIERLPEERPTPREGMGSAPVNSS